MSKRIFSKVFVGRISIASAVVSSQNALASWLAQEDIEVVGAEVEIDSAIPSENDGYARLALELSQVGIYGQDGAILMAAGGEGWNTSPAGICRQNGHAFVTFPAGFAVPVKEEGYLYLNVIGEGKTAGLSVFAYEVIVYYTKRGA